MRRTILNGIILLALVFVPMVVHNPAYAAPKGGGGKNNQGGQQQAQQQNGGGGGNGNQQCGNTPAAQQVLSGIDQAGNSCGDNQVDNIFQTIIQLLSILVGVTAVIAIIWSGFKYITSGGEQNKVQNAKNTLLYALIGLSVAALAQLLIHFVLFQTNKT